MKNNIISTSGNDRVPLIDSIKGFAIFLVCWGHSIQFIKKDGTSFFENPIFIFIYSFHMPLFMMISGYLFFYSLGRYNVRRLTIKRFTQLIIPSLSWFVLESFLIGRNINIPNLKYGAVFPFWFLSSLFYISVTMAVSYAICKDKSWVIFIGVFIASLFLGDSWNMDRTKFMAPYFLLGVCAHYFISYIHLHKHKIGLISIITWIVMFLFWERDYYIYITKMTFHGVDFTHQLNIVLFRYVIGFAGSFSAIYLYSFTCKLKSFSLIASYLGAYTLPIYIISTLILSRIAGLFNINEYCKNIIIYNFLIAPAFSIFIILICVSLAIILKRIWFTRVLFLGGR